ncbi:MAG: reverse transcriptase family protein, partial [Candidatus Thiodiazotropha endolucinida]|nr:reverse transcriptase family protein [Candidatus Thiodiazotropha taylori]MCW4263153.1 reverse transcriptase family protein [Candidatus Thiodiazotropha endolucinida]
KFYQLIRRNKGGHNGSTCSIMSNGDEIRSPEGQREVFAQYFEDLATPKDKNYDSAFLEMCSVRHQLIEEMANECSTFPEPITEEEVHKAISQLNSKKAADELGLVAEHLKYSGASAISEITDIFNTILAEKNVPQLFKTGILTPVLKKSKDASLMDNYRGITVTPVLGKLFEITILPRLSECFDQSSLQFGFTKQLSPIMSALIVSEARAETKLKTDAPLFLVTLDSRKAFDVVNHVILLDKLYDTGVHPTLWSIVNDMYKGLTSRVKWQGQFSNRFNILQGVRQGAILSPFLYKTYINPCLVELKENRLGLCIGTVYCGCPTCADDLAMLSNCENELQLMSNVVKRNARQYRVTIHPDKSNAVMLKSHKSVIKKSFGLELEDKTIPLSSSTTHLGILRSETQENIINIEQRLSLARRTLYALINTGLHGSNGLNPKVAYKIYQCYVIPRLLYGLEVLPLNITQLDILRKFHLNNLRRFQSLPTRTASCAVYLLLGALPIEAELHKRQLSLLFNVLTTSNETINQLNERQIIMNSDNSHSFYGRTQEILKLYNLPDMKDLKNELSTKDQWKIRTKQAVNKHWTEILKSEAKQRSTLKYLNVNSLSIGKVHPVWSSLESTVRRKKRNSQM